MRRDLGHVHDSLDATVACVRVTKVAQATSTLPEAESPAPAPVPSTERGKTGRPRKHPDSAARQRAYRERQRPAA